MKWKSSLLGVGALISTLVASKAIGGVVAATTTAAAEALLPACLTSLGAASELGKVAGQITEGVVGTGIRIALNCYFNSTASASRVVVSTDAGASSATAQVLAQTLTKTNNCSLTPDDPTVPTSVSVASYPGALFQQAALPIADPRAYKITSNDTGSISPIANAIGNDPAAQGALAEAASQADGVNAALTTINLQKTALLRAQAQLIQAVNDTARCDANLADAQTSLSGCKANFTAEALALAEADAMLLQAQTQLNDTTTQWGECRDSLNDTTTQWGECRDSLNDATTKLGGCTDSLIAATDALARTNTSLTACTENLSGIEDTNVKLWVFFGITGTAALVLAGTAFGYWRKNKKRDVEDVVVTVGPPTDSTPLNSA